METLQRQLESSLKRWHPLRHLPITTSLHSDQFRFKVVPAGRRSGKTERFKRHVITELIKPENAGHRYFAAAPTSLQAKKIYWNDFKLMIPPMLIEKVMTSEQYIRLYNGAEIHVVGLDKPARIEGQPWNGGGVDEIADIKATAWQENIRPLFDTIGMEDSWCWLIGVPDGLNHYYELAEYARNSGDPEWGFYTWKSSEILSEKAIASAKRQLDPRAFRQEYEASFETASGRVYADYCNDNHSQREFDPNLPIIWTHDFNFTPLSSAILQVVGKDVYVVDEIILESAVAANTAAEFVEKYKHCNRQTVKIYGDASGRAGEKHGIASDFTIIRDSLKAAGFENVLMKMPNANPSIKDGQNSLRAKILNAAGERSFFVNPAKAKHVDKGLKTTQLKEGSTFQEEDSTYQHVTTALRYYTNVDFPIVRNTVTSHSAW